MSNLLIGAIALVLSAIVAALSVGVGIVVRNRTDRSSKGWRK